MSMLIPVCLTVKTQEAPGHEYNFNRGMATRALLGSLQSILQSTEKNQTHEMIISHAFPENGEI